jgi:mannose-6-phosphate isomerase-like protein (cupin superfamily)
MALNPLKYDESDFIVIPSNVTGDIFSGNISNITEDNSYFRRVLATTPNMQLVVMSLQPGEEIGMEVHPYVTQFIRVEKGNGLAIINDNSYQLTDGSAVIIPSGSQHNIINTSYTELLQLYTIYSPPNHPRTRLNVENPEPTDCD